MSVNLVVNGATFSYPTQDDPPDWGYEATAWATAVTNGLIPKSGGLFTLTGDLDLGNSKGIKVAYVKQSTTDPIGNAGILRLARTGTISWRNSTDSTDLQLGVNALNQLTLNGALVGGGVGTVPGGYHQLLASDGSGYFFNVPYGTSGQLLVSNGLGTTWVDSGTVIGSTGIKTVGTLPVSASAGDSVLLTTNGGVYTYSGSAWVPISGTITSGAVLPVTGTTGQTFFLTTDAKLYRWAGSAWVATVPTGDLTGTLATSQLADSLITNVKLAAGAVTAAKTNLAAISATTGALTANSVTNTTIADGAISTPKLTANVITSNELSALSVVAGKLAADSVSTANLQAYSVVAGKVQAGSISSAELASGSVTTNKLSVVIGSGNLLSNAGFEILNGGGGNRPLYWGFTGVSGTHTRPNGVSAGSFGAGYLVSATAGVTPILGMIDENGVITGRAMSSATQYMLTFYARKTNGSAWTTMAVVPDTEPGGTGTITGTAVTNPILSGTYQRYTFSVAVSPFTDYSAANLQVRPNGVSSSVGDVIEIDNIQLEVGDVATSWSPQATELLPGTIVANMLSAGSVQTAALAANSVVAGKIAADAIVASNIQVGSLTGDRLAANTVDADRIVSNSLTSAQIQAGAIQADRIQVGSLTTTQVAPGGINADRLVAASIVTDNLQVGAVTASAVTASSFTTIMPFTSYQSIVNVYSPDPWVTFTSIGKPVYIAFNGCMEVGLQDNAQYNVECGGMVAVWSAPSLYTGVYQGTIGLYSSSSRLVSGRTSYFMQVNAFGFILTMPAGTYVMYPRCDVVIRNPTTGALVFKLGTINLAGQISVFELKV
jgi:hypothetical protein